MRASAPSWAATAATPANIRPEAVKVAAIVSVASAPPPTATVRRKQTTPSATEATTAMRIATARRD